MTPEPPSYILHLRGIQGVQSGCSAVTLGRTCPGLGVWVGQLNGTSTVIGAQNTIPANGLFGCAAHIAVFDYVIDDAGAQDLATI